MTQAIRPESKNSGTRESTGEGLGAHALNKAVQDAYHVYHYRDLEQNLRKFAWRKARREVLRHGALSGEWIGRGRSEVRLTRAGLEVRLAGQTQRLSWPDLQELATNRRR